MLTDVKALRKTLRGLADLLADEAERNTAFAEALQNLLYEGAPPKRSKVNEPRKTASEVKGEALDPFAVLGEKGPEGFKEWLGTLNIPALKAMVRQHRLDPTRLSDKWKTPERFVELVFERVQDRVSQGESFRNYGERKAEATVNSTNAEGSQGDRQVEG